MSLSHSSVAFRFGLYSLILSIVLDRVAYAYGTVPQRTDIPHFVLPVYDLAISPSFLNCCRTATCTLTIGKECMERGVSLVPLAVKGVTTGLYGKACVSVGDPKGGPLPAHRLSAGDQVRLYSTKGNAGSSDEGPTEISGGW